MELAEEVVLLIYRATREFLKEEMYGLTSKMRRARTWESGREGFGTPASINAQIVQAS
jgi:hypothetical protein